MHGNLSQLVHHSINRCLIELVLVGMHKYTITLSVCARWLLL